MHAHEIAEPYPVIQAETSALDAARMIARERRPGLVVIGRDGAPSAVLSASQVVQFMVPDYVQDDPNLAGVMGEEPSAKIAERLQRATVASLLPREPDELPVLNSDDTVLEVAAIMARLSSPLAVVMDGGEILGVITASRLLETVLGDSQ
ncbi:MAG TPA: hypothetical protein DCM67_01425 [Propionibacteriaceae bacterium]|jgi:CBS domain-containing protein|nr:hypothetical protein [Propionibacteriaceae bacterium]HML49866.1 CBS domain-containing protein [Propionicimonas sp.]